MGRRKEIMFITISIFILLTILFYPEIYSQYEVVFEKKNTEFGKENRWNYGYYTHFVSQKGVMGPYVYGVGDDNGDICRIGAYSNEWDMDIIRAPKKLDDTFIGSVYMTDSLVYVVGSNGYAYSVDMEYMRIIDMYNFNELFGDSKEMGTYYILWGNKTGYLYMLVNNTIFYIYKDLKILNQWYYNFTGYYVSSYPWDGGFLLRFKDFKGATWIYYVKNGSIVWEITTRSRVRCYQNFVYEFKNDEISIYRDGKKLIKLIINGNVADVNRIDNLTYVAVYLFSKNYLMVFDVNFKILKTLVLCDMGTTWYKVNNQNMGVFKNESGYTILLYTSDIYGPFVPLRIIHLDKHFNIVDSIIVKNGGGFRIVYPIGKKYVGADLEFDLLYVFSVKHRIHVNFFAWMQYKVPVILFSTLIMAHIYFSWKKVKRFKEEIQKGNVGEEYIEKLEK